MDFSALIEKGEELFSNGQINDAETIFNYVLKSDPKNHSVLNILEIIKHHQNKYETKEERQQNNRDSLNNARIAIINTYENKFNEIYASYFSKRNEVRILIPKTENDLLGVVKWADIIWSTWSNEPLVYLSQLKKTFKLFTHIRSYELLTPNLMKNILWQNIDGIIFVADHIREIANQMWRSQISSVSQTTINNCVNLDEYPLYETGPGKHIAYIGFLNHKKGVGLLLQCIKKAVQKDANFRFHIAGVFQETRFQVYMEHLVKEMDLEKHVIHHGWIANVAHFLSDMNFVVSASPWEGCPNNVIEAMACGIKPIIHNWRGAKQLFPEECIFNTIDDFFSIISSEYYEPDKYRSYVEEHFNADYQLPKIDSFFKKKAEPKITKPRIDADSMFPYQSSTIGVRNLDLSGKRREGGFENIRIGWLPFGDRNTASSRLRTFKIHDYLVQHSKKYRSEILKQLESSISLDILILQRVYGDEQFNQLLHSYRKQGVKIILDLCDIYPEAKETASSVDLITTNSDYRRNQLIELGFIDNIHVIGDPIDYNIDHCYPHPDFEQLRTVWFGTYSNIYLINMLASVIDATAITSANVKNKIPQNWKYEEWQYDWFVEKLRKSNLCVLPQKDNGKSPNKMVTAILCGLPVIASNIEPYRKLSHLLGVEDFLCDTLNDWAEAIKLMSERDMRLDYLQKAQKTLLSEFTIGKIGNQWNEIFQILTNTK